MKMKRVFSIVLTLSLVFSLLGTVTFAASEDYLTPVTDPVIGETYYLAADVDGTLKFFTTGTVTSTAPYSLVTTERSSIAVQVTLENSTATSENFEGGFQMTFYNDGTLTRIYCMDVLKDATTAGQTGIMDTGVNSAAPYKNRHSFWVDEVDGVKVLRKYGNDNILVVKYNETTKTYRMLGVPESELSSDGVYPASFYAEHTHNYVGGVCSCGEKKPAVTPMTDPESAVGSDRLMYLYAEDGDGVAHYMRPAKSAATSDHGYKESVGNISPYGFYTSTNLSEASKYSVLTATCDSTTETEYKLQYYDDTNSTNYILYLRDVGAGPGLLTNEAHDKHHLLWDAKNEYFYRVHTDGVTYVLVMKSVSVTYDETSTLPGTTQNEWRITTAPVADLDEEGVYKVNLGYHDHTYEEGKCVCGDEIETEPLNEGIYYLKATHSGTTYYFRHTLSGETVTYTTPYSLYTTEDKSAAKLVEVVKQDSGGYTLEYPYSSGTARIYVYDVSSDGTIDTGVNTGNEEAKHHFQWDGYNGRLYQMEGSVKYVLAMKELANSNTSEMQIRLQAVPESELSDTVVTVELEAHTTHTVDTWVETTPATTTTTGVKTGTCTVCEREVSEEIPVLVPSISGYSISLKDNFAINFFVKTADFEDGYYTAPYMVFTMQEQKTTVTEYTTRDDYYVFTFDNLAPDLMLETVTAELYAAVAEEVACVYTGEYSVADYGYTALRNEGSGDALCKLLVETLNFGAASQTYRNREGALANAELTDDEKALGDTGDLRDLTSCRDFGTYDASHLVKWYGATLAMSDSIKLRVYFEADNITDLTIKAAGENVGEHELTNIVSKNGRYYVDFAELNPAQMSEEVTFTAYKNGKAVSTTMTYSIESYAKAWRENPEVTDEQKGLVEAVIRYGDAAKEYIQRAFDLQEDVCYMGRTYALDGKQWFNWSASGFSVQFQGSGLQAKIASNAPDATNYAYLKVYVDGKEQEDILLNATMNTVTLAEGLDPDVTHTVEVRKRNSPRSSTAGLTSLEVVDGTKLEAPAKKELLIEFVGDSLTVGYSAADVDKTETAWSTKTEDGTKTYSKQVADAFGAEYMVTAISGRGVVMNNSGGSGYLLPEIYPELDIYNRPGAAYDFALKPDVIVINLGTNDATNSDLDIDAFQAGVVSFINLVRDKNPNAQIIWAYGLRSDKKTAEVAAAIEEAVAQVNTAGDSKVHYLALELATDMHLNHPTAAAYAPSGEKLIEKITEITGWTK